MKELAERIAQAVWEKLMGNEDVIASGAHEGCESDPIEECTLYGDILNAVTAAMEQETK